MRVIAGKFKGRKLTGLKGRQIRPTSDRIREALFSILSERIENAVVLDLFAGTGALGIEALSRGAAKAFFIDKSKQAFDIIEKNIELLEIKKGAEIFLHDAYFIRNLKTIVNQKFDLIFMDPPYDKGILNHMFGNVDLLSIMDDNSVIITENSVREKRIENVSGLDLFDRRTYGETLISFFKKEI